MDRMRRALTLATAALLAAARPAAAQLCHVPAPGATIDAGAHATAAHRHTSPVHVALAAGVGAATVTSGDMRVSYQATTLRASVAWSRLAVQLDVAGYRLDRDGYAVTGLGDVGVAPWVTLRQRGRIGVMIGVPTSLPTGNAVDRLGMGHVMAMPTLDVRLRGDRTTTRLGVQYGRAFGAAGHMHGDGLPGALVAPMAASELGMVAAVETTLTPQLRVAADAGLALPTGGGDPRALLGVGLAWQWSSARVDVHVARGALLRPVDASGAITLTWTR